VVRFPSGAGRAITRNAFEGVEIDGKAVLVETGWDAHWRTERYLTGHPFLTADAAEYLASRGVTLVGIDSLNIDDTADAARPVHSTLLAAGVPIVEHMCNLGPSGAGLQILRGAREGRRIRELAGAGLGTCPSVKRPSRAFPPSPFARLSWNSSSSRVSG